MSREVMVWTEAGPKINSRQIKWLQSSQTRGCALGASRKNAAMRNSAYTDKPKTLPQGSGTRRCDAVRDQRKLCCSHTTLPFGRPAQGELNIHGRSPDSWVTARPILPRLASSGDHRVCSPHTVAGAVTELAAFDGYRTVFPFHPKLAQAFPRTMNVPMQ